MKPRVVCSTNQLLFATNKDVLLALQKSNVIHRFSCHCNSRYVGCTFQRLQSKSKQHVPKFICSCFFSRNAYFLHVVVILPPRPIPSSLLLLILPLDFIFYKIRSVRNIMMTVDSLFSPKAALLSIYICF